MSSQRLLLALHWALWISVVLQATVFTAAGSSSSIRNRRATFKPSLLPSPVQLIEQAECLSTEWSRYLFLRQFLDCVPEESSSKLKFVGDVGWEEMNLVLALSLGFRVDEEKNVVYHSQALCPYGWSSLEATPNVADLFDQALEYHMHKDLPADDGATDMVLETIVGLFMHEHMKKAKEHDMEVRRRVLVARWLYVQGFLSTTFPPRERFVPAHIRNAIDDEEEDEE